MPTRKALRAATRVGVADAIVREVSQDWNIDVSYAADCGVVEVLVLDLKSGGAMPMHRMGGNIAPQRTG